jgi:hypothetical protein
MVVEGVELPDSFEGEVVGPRSIRHLHHEPGVSIACFSHFSGACESRSHERRAFTRDVDVLRERQRFGAVGGALKITALEKTLAQSQSRSFEKQARRRGRDELLQTFTLEHEIARGAREFSESPEGVFSNERVVCGDCLITGGGSSEISGSFRDASEEFLSRKSVSFDERSLLISARAVCQSAASTAAVIRSGWATIFSAATVVKTKIRTTLANDILQIIMRLQSSFTQRRKDRRKGAKWNVFCLSLRLCVCLCAFARKNAALI